MNFAPIDKNLGKRFVNPEKPDIVIVDDNADNLRILSDMLRNHGYRPRPVKSAEMAIKTISASPPVIILLDVMMPETNGLALCRRLKSKNETKDIPVIFITALDQLENKVRAFAAGGVDYITKPFDEAEAMARIQTHVRLVRAKQDLQKSQGRIRQYQKYESLVRMAGAIAHRFNNDLQAIIGNLEMAISDCENITTVPTPLSAAINAARNAAEMSKLMVTYTGKSHAVKKYLDLTAWCETNIPALISGFKNRIIITKYRRYPGSLILASDQQIKQLTEALLKNAIEASKTESDPIIIFTDKLKADSIPLNNRFPVGWSPDNILYECLGISDNGCGIEEKDIEQIFDPFYTTGFTGRGLGLPMILGIAIAHNGGITVESTPEKGSTFRVFFPVANPGTRAADGYFR